MTTVREALANAERDLDVADAQLRAAQGRYDDLLRERDGLRLAIEKYGLDVDADVTKRSLT